MSLNIDINKLESLETDIQGIKERNETTYDEISSLSSTISGNWSSSGSDAFINKYDEFSSTFDDYDTALSSINKYLTNTKEEYLNTQEKVSDIIEV